MVKFFNLIYLIVIVLLISLIIWLYYLNRDSELIKSKVYPALLIGCIGVFFTIWFSLKSEKVECRFDYTVYFNNNDNKLLDEYYPKQYAFGGSQFDIHCRNFINSKIVNIKDKTELEDFYFDLAIIKLFSRFSWLYADSWDVYVNSVRQGNAFTSELDFNKPKPTCMQIEYEKLGLNSNSETLIDFFKESRFVSKKIMVPPKTNLKIIESNHKKIVSFKNPFVEINISFFPRGGSLGLGDYQWLLAYDNQKNHDFWSKHLAIFCEAKFERLRSGNPEMPRYKKWAQTMFEEIQFLFDDEKRLKRALDYKNVSQ